MKRSLPSAPIRRGLMISLLAGLAACQAEAPKPVASESCLTERADFVSATDRTALRGDTAPATPSAQGLTTDLAKAADAVDRVTSSFATLKACRLDRAEEIRTGVAGGSLPAAQMAPLLAGERSNFEGEIEIARGAARQLEQRAAGLRQAADKLATTAPGVDLKVARAAAAPPPPAQYFVATAAAPIYAKPAATASRLASLRRGQRVQGPGGEAAPGWVQLTLNDGSAGYVDSGVLRPAQTNASALKAAARAEGVREAAGDPIAAAVLAARVGLPDRQQALTALIETTAEQMALAFKPELPATASSDGEPDAAPVP